MWITLLNLSGEVPIADYTPLGKVLVGFMGLFVRENAQRSTSLNVLEENAQRSTSLNVLEDGSSAPPPYLAATGILLVLC